MIESNFLFILVIETNVIFRLEKVCVDDICENPCTRIASHLMVCDCPSIDPDTGFASDDRCQLCCYDFNIVSNIKTRSFKNFLLIQ